MIMNSDTACGLYLSASPRNTTAYALPPHHPFTSNTQRHIHLLPSSPTPPSLFCSLSLPPSLPPCPQLLIQCTNHQLNKSMTQPITITSNQSCLLLRGKAADTFIKASFISGYRPGRVARILQDNTHNGRQKQQEGGVKRRKRQTEKENPKLFPVNKSWLQINSLCQNLSSFNRWDWVHCFREAELLYVCVCVLVLRQERDWRMHKMAASLYLSLSLPLDPLEAQNWRIDVGHM